MEFPGSKENFKVGRRLEGLEGGRREWLSPCAASVQLNEQRLDVYVPRGHPSQQPMSAAVMLPKELTARVWLRGGSV
jgi:hypothetical protein